MSLLSLIFGRKKHEVFDPNPGETSWMPARPYRVIQPDLPFYSDPQCKRKVQSAHLILLQCEDPKQKQRTVECMPTRKNYEAGQLVSWDLDNKKIWGNCWYKNPDTNNNEKAWSQAVEFIGRVAIPKEPAG